MQIEPMSDDQRKAVAVEYLKRVDRGDRLFELFDDHAHVYFPKWGLAKGRQQYEQLFGDIVGLFKSIVHEAEYYNYIIHGDTVVLEGTTYGTTTANTAWRHGASYGGRGCAVMEIRGFKIHRLFIYVDPDYDGADTARYPWLATNRHQ